LKCDEPTNLVIFDANQWVDRNVWRVGFSEAKIEGIAARVTITRSSDDRHRD
jgi:hypothetical protein